MEDRNKLFAELAGIHWHEWSDDGGRHYSEWRSYSCDCGATTESPTEPKGGPDFTDAREVLKVMRKRDDYAQFLLEKIFKYGWSGKMVCDLLLDTTGRLHDQAVEFLEGRK